GIRYRNVTGVQTCALPILRDLSVTSRRFKDLHDGLPRIPTSVLTARLRDLQRTGVVTRVADEQPGGGVLYRLTAHGRALEPILRSEERRVGKECRGSRRRQ